jgi:hypothetical protein
MMVLRGPSASAKTCVQRHAAAAAIGAMAHASNENPLITNKQGLALTNQTALFQKKNVQA